MVELTAVLCCCQAANVPTVPGSDGLIKDNEDALAQVANIGFPVMIKATAGGGGRGMRLCREEAEFIPLLTQASQEAQAAFGNGAVYLERYVQDPRHIEFQVRACLPSPIASNAVSKDSRAVGWRCYQKESFSSKRKINFAQ